MTGLSGARRRVRGDSHRCCWPKCPRERSEKYPEQPLCTEHAAVVHDRVETSRAKQRADTAEYVNRTRQRNGLPPLVEVPFIGDVYYLRIGENIKIGHTTNLLRRMATYPPDTEILATHRGSRADEAELHDRFRQFRTAGREWYRDSGEVRAHIAEMIAQHGKPDPSLRTKREVRPNRQAVTIRSRSGGTYGRTG